jgi:FtsZ-interacting cell division protein ZipA
MDNKNKKIILGIAIIIVIVLVVIIIAKLSGKESNDKNNSTKFVGESIATTEKQSDSQIETVTDENGQVITQVSPNNAENKQGSSTNSDSSDNKSSNKSENGVVNEMDDIFTDEAIENTTTKKDDSQKTTDKNGDAVETKAEDANSHDGWSDFY